MSEIVTFTDADGNVHHAAEGSRAHVLHLRANPVEKAEPAKAQADAKPAPKVALDRK